MALERQNRKMRAGDSRDLKFIVPAIDIYSGASLYWALGRTRGGTAVLSKSGEGVTVDGTTVTVIIASGDTSDLSGNYFHQLRAVDAGGTAAVLVEGLVRVLPTMF